MDFNQKDFFLNLWFSARFAVSKGLSLKAFVPILLFISELALYCQESTKKDMNIATKWGQNGALSYVIVSYLYKFFRGSFKFMIAMFIYHLRNCRGIFYLKFSTWNYPVDYNKIRSGITFLEFLPVLVSFIQLFRNRTRDQ